MVIVLLRHQCCFVRDVERHYVNMWQSMLPINFLENSGAVAGYVWFGINNFDVLLIVRLIANVVACEGIDTRKNRNSG